MAERTEGQGFREWCLLELLGHRRVAGLITEATIGGAALTRIDVYLPGGEQPVVTQFYGPSAIYAITPLAEEVARRFAQRNTPEPVSRYDLPQLEPPRRRTCRECGEALSAAEYAAGETICGACADGAALDRDDDPMDQDDGRDDQSVDPPF